MSIQYEGRTLVDGAEIAEMLGTKLKTVINYHHSARRKGYPKEPGKFPKPYVTISGHHLWLKEDAEEYATQRPSARRAAGVM